jgi:uncharacterized protein (TIGR00288 family)
VNETSEARLASRAPRETRNTSGNAALLIDFDNVTMGIRSDLQHQLKELLNSEIIKGKVAVQRAYADWRRYPQYIVPLSESSIDLIFAPAFGSNKKNATDIRLAIDALELVFTRPEINTFILLSGDSDFSSLVLKLKEYGKWVIGVGIRESASDLLVQNCDEYYSYTELTGFAKEGETEVMRRDPWELVVEATLHMKESNDTMRSDRLKQVMQQLDPHFDEKDAGFNRFSKFVLEARRRKLLELEKMESGQYQIDIGPDANVPPDSVTPPAEEEEPREAKPQKRSARGAKGAAASGTLTLADGFALLKEVLVDLQAIGENSTDARRARERMTALASVADDPIFEARRFSRMLRQARDAGIIDLVKDGRVYRLRLKAEALAEDVSEPVERQSKGREQPEKTTKTSRPRAQAKDEEPAAVQQSGDGESADAKKKVAKRSPRSRGGKRSGKVAEKREAAPEGAVQAPTFEEVKPPQESGHGGEAKPARRSVRGRGSSRTYKKPKTTTPDSVLGEPTPEVEPVLPRAIPTAPRRSIRGRGSSRRTKQAPIRNRVPPDDRSAARDKTESAVRERKDAVRHSPHKGEIRGSGRRDTDLEGAARSDARSKSRVQRRPTPGRSDEDAPGEKSPQGALRSSRETKAAASLVEKRAVHESKGGSGFFKQLLQSFRGEDKNE